MAAPIRVHTYTYRLIRAAIRKEPFVSLKKRITAMFAPEPAPEPAPAKNTELFALFEFGDGGEFDYEAYRAAQVTKAQSDTGDVWADPKTLDVIADYARAKIPNLSFLLCHGSKAGMESRHLAERLGCEGIGTDISPPQAAQGVVEWDFHEKNDEWKGRASLVYTNALDHAYDPKKAIDAWVDQLAPEGLIFIEHTMLHAPEGSSASDPFGAHPLIMPYLILDWGQGKYCVRDVIKPEHKKPHWKPVEGERPDTDLDIWVFVIARNA